MTKFQDTQILRSGATNSSHTVETEECSYYLDTSENKLNICFNLSAAGGGTTVVKVAIGAKDICSVVNDSLNELKDIFDKDIKIKIKNAS